MVVSCDVVFDEKVAWDWDSPSTGEAGGFTSTFVVEHLVIHGGGDAGEEVSTTPAIESSTPGAVPSTSRGVLSTLGVVSSGPAMVPITPGRVPNALVTEPRGLVVVPTTPRLVPTTPGVVMSGPGVVPSTAAGVPSTPGAVPTTPAEQRTPSTSIEFASPPSDITEFVDAFHDVEREEMRFCRLDTSSAAQGPQAWQVGYSMTQSCFSSVQRNHPYSR